MPDRLNRDLTKLTPGERLFLARKAAGRTQIEAAAAAHVGRTRWAEGERGEKPVRGAVDPVKTADLGLLTRLARRRSGRGRDWVCRALGVSAPTLNAWERKGDERLIAFWKKKGFTFARARD